VRPSPKRSRESEPEPNLNPLHRPLFSLKPVGGKIRPGGIGDVFYAAVMERQVGFDASRPYLLYILRDDPLFFPPSPPPPLFENPRPSQKISLLWESVVAINRVSDHGRSGLWAFFPLSSCRKVEMEIDDLRQLSRG